MRHNLIKFNVTGTSGQTIKNAKLRIYDTTDPSVTGGDVHRSDNNWTESTVNGTNAPSKGQTAGIVEDTR